MQENSNFENQCKLPPEPTVLTHSENSDFTYFLPRGFNEKSYKEKKEIKKAANTAGISVIIMLCISFFFSLIYTLFTFTIKNEEITNILKDSAILTALQILISITAFGVMFTLVYKIAGYRISDLVSFKRTEKGKALPVFFFGVAFCSFSNIASNIIAAFFSAFGIEYSRPDIDLPRGLFGFLLTFISTAVVPALVEEYAFRGLVMGTLKKFGSGFAVITSAILFGLIHCNFEQIPFAFEVGLFLGYSVIITGSLRVAICVHFFNNLISVIFSYFFDNISVNIQNLIYTVFLLLSLVAGIVCLNCRKNNSLFYFEKSDTECREPQKYKWFFLSVAVVIGVILCMAEAVLNI